MIANKTTLIVGAGASVDLDYPTGVQLKDWIVDGRGITNNYGDEGIADRKKLTWRLKRSLIPSIDAFLAEEENADLRAWGVICIAAALLPCESLKKSAPPQWLQMLFNAIRGRKTEQRQEKLKIVTFNYDLSIEFFLFHAFLAAYKLSSQEARKAFEESVEVIHVYGHLGQIMEFGGNREYGAPVETYTINDAKNNLVIIGRKPEDPLFTAAQAAIAEAEFIAILGFGYDETNVANLRMVDLTKSKFILSTAYDMGVGMRGWINHMGIKNVLFGMPQDDVTQFLHRSAFFRWANTPGMKAEEMYNAIYTAPMRLPEY
ncbi:MAG: hypothetical protein WDN28_15585 [Chthoniobacter sp.]